MKKKFLAVLSCGLAATFLFGCSKQYVSEGGDNSCTDRGCKREPETV